MIVGVGKPGCEFVAPAGEQGCVFEQFAEGTVAVVGLAEAWLAPLQRLLDVCIMLISPLTSCCTRSSLEGSTRNSTALRSST